MSKLTIKQEKFCNKYLESGNASEAYRAVYGCKGWKDESVWENASRLLNNSKVAARVAELRKEMENRSNMSKDEVIAWLTSIIKGEEIDDYKRISENNKSDYSVTTRQKVSKQWALEKLCKVMGYDSPTKNELTGANGSALFPSFTVEVIDRREQVEGRADTTDTAGTA